MINTWRRCGVFCVLWRHVQFPYFNVFYRLTKGADVAGAVDSSLQRSGYRVGVGDNSDVGGLIVDLGASAHRPRRIQLLVDAACFDTERRVAALRVRIVELNQVETTTRIEHVLAQQKLRPGPNFASTSMHV